MESINLNLSSQSTNNSSIYFTLFPPLNTVDSNIYMQWQFSVSDISESDLKLLQLNYMSLNNCLIYSELSLNNKKVKHQNPSNVIHYKKHYVNLTENMSVERNGSIFTVTERFLNTMFDEQQILYNVSRLDIHMNLHTNLFTRLFASELNGSVQLLKTFFNVKVYNPVETPVLCNVPFYQPNIHQCKYSDNEYRLHMLNQIPNKVYVYTDKSVQINSFSLTIPFICNGLFKELTSKELWELSVKNGSMQTYELWCKASVLCFTIPHDINMNNVMIDYDIGLSDNDCDVIIVHDLSKTMVISKDECSVQQK